MENTADGVRNEERALSAVQLGARTPDQWTNGKTLDTLV
jgi:hypothetical protein